VVFDAGVVPEADDAMAESGCHSCSNPYHAFAAEGGAWDSVASSALSFLGGESDAVRGYRGVMGPDLKQSRLTLAARGRLIGLNQGDGTVLVTGALVSLGGLLSGAGALVLFATVDGRVGLKVQNQRTPGAARAGDRSSSADDVMAVTQGAVVGPGAWFEARATLDGPVVRVYVDNALVLEREVAWGWQASYGTGMLTVGAGSHHPMLSGRTPVEPFIGDIAWARYV
jgi:hypothetical protein